MEIFSPGHGNFHFQSKKKVFGSIFLSLSLGYKDGKRVYIYISDGCVILSNYTRPFVDLT